ncbi:hypothetical protein Tco_1339698 [Tanacetum coccineum]
MHRIANVALVSVRDVRGVLEGYERGVEGEINLPYVFVVKERERDRSTLVKLSKRYRYIKNHKKTVKNGQSMTQETEEYKRAKDSKLKSKRVNFSQKVPKPKWARPGSKNPLP